VWFPDVVTGKVWQDAKTKKKRAPNDVNPLLQERRKQEKQGPDQTAHVTPRIWPTSTASNSNDRKERKERGRSRRMAEHGEKKRRSSGEGTRSIAEKKVGRGGMEIGNSITHARATRPATGSGGEGGRREESGGGGDLERSPKHNKGEKGERQEKNTATLTREKEPSPRTPLSGKPETSTNA